MKSRYNWESIFEGIQSGNRVMLGRGLSLIESQKPADREQAFRLIEACNKDKNIQSHRIGITGAPGVGKSSTIEKLGLEAIKEGYRVAVLAVDPSSSITGGSILGDKTRMPELSASQDAFIRPSAAGMSLGGVSLNTRESILLCEAAGYNFILVETVGVGQSETEVYNMTDMFVCLLLPGAGDELQGIKRGIIEMADLLVINKADGDRIQLAKQSRKDYKNAIHYLRPKVSDWKVNVITYSNLHEDSPVQLLKEIEAFFRYISESKYLTQKRSAQAIKWFDQLLIDEIYRLVFQTQLQSEKKIAEIKQSVERGEKSPHQAVQEIISGLSTGLNK